MFNSLHTQKSCKEHAQQEAKRVAHNLCSKFPHISNEECRDFAQDALLKWCENLDRNSIEQPDHPYTWLYSSAKGNLLNYQKRAKHLAGLEAIILEPSHEPEANDWEIQRDFEMSLFDAGLNFHERVTVRIKTAFGNSWNEIAAYHADGMSADSLRQTYHRAIGKLKRFAKKEKARGTQKPPLATTLPTKME